MLCVIDDVTFSFIFSIVSWAWEDHGIREIHSLMWLFPREFLRFTGYYLCFSVREADADVLKRFCKALPDFCDQKFKCLFHSQVIQLTSKRTDDHSRNCDEFNKFFSRTKYKENQILITSEISRKLSLKSNQTFSDDENIMQKTGWTWQMSLEPIGFIDQNYFRFC